MVVARMAPLAFTRGGWMDDEVRARLDAWMPRSLLGETIAKIAPLVPREYALELLDRAASVCVVESTLELVVFRAPGSAFRLEDVEDYGIVSRKVITDAFVAAIVDALDVGVGFTLSNLRYHGIGTGSTAEAAADTALVTELTTEYTGNVRATGTATQPTAPQYRSTATNTLDSGTPALREHGVLSQAATGGGTLLDRSVYAAINLDGTVGDALQSVYTASFTAGG